MIVSYCPAACVAGQDSTPKPCHNDGGLSGQVLDIFLGLSAAAEVADVDEVGKTVFLVWECPGCGYYTATDTFVFGPDNKIKRQNIVVTKGAPEKSKKSKKKKSYSIC